MILTVKLPKDCNPSSFAIINSIDKARQLFLAKEFGIFSPNIDINKQVEIIRLLEKEYGRMVWSYIGFQPLNITAIDMAILAGAEILEVNSVELCDYILHRQYNLFNIFGDKI